MTVGAVVGLGAGGGKGRIQAALARYVTECLGIKRFLWFTTSSSLLADGRRDCRAVGTISIFFIAHFCLCLCTYTDGPAIRVEP